MEKQHGDEDEKRRPFSTARSATRDLNFPGSLSSAGDLKPSVVGGLPVVRLFLIAQPNYFLLLSEQAPVMTITTPRTRRFLL